MESNSVISAYSPPFKIVAKYFISAIISFVLLTFLLVVSYDSFGGHHFQPRVLALTHIATLGWITMIIFGALFQLVPVVLEVKLYSERLAEIQFWIYALGVIGMIYCFWFFETSSIIIISAVLLNVAMYIFAFNITATLRTVKNWNLTGYYLAAAIFHLVVTAIAGLLLAINLYSPYIKIDHLQYLNLHAHVAFIGWVGMVIMGVTYKLIPMFTLSHGYSLGFGKVAFWLINLGLLGISTVMHYKDTTFFYYVFSALIISGLFSFLYQTFLIFNKRIRRKADIGIKFSYAAYIAMGMSTLTGVLIAITDYSTLINFSLIYGVLIVLGFISMLIVGQMYKIVPFLVWYHKYSSKVGIEKVPMLKDMFNEKYAVYGFYLMIISTAGIITALGLRNINIFGVSAVILFISGIIFLFNMITIFRK